MFSLKVMSSGNKFAYRSWSSWWGWERRRPPRHQSISILLLLLFIAAFDAGKKGKNEEFKTSLASNLLWLTQKIMMQDIIRQDVKTWSEIMIQQLLIVVFFISGRQERIKRTLITKIVAALSEVQMQLFGDYQNNKTNILKNLNGDDEFSPFIISMMVYLPHRSLPQSIPCIPIFWYCR